MITEYFVCIFYVKLSVESQELLPYLAPGGQAIRPELLALAGGMETKVRTLPVQS